MIQLVVNVNLLRELNENKLITAYANYQYNSEEDLTNRIKIKKNLIQLLDWDINGDSGLGIYCGKFESIKRKDWEILIDLIIDRKLEIIRLSEEVSKKKFLENNKVILKGEELKYWKYHNKVLSKDYKPSKRGKKAKGCFYKNKYYNSRLECIHKEGISKNELYKYLYKTNQLDIDSSLYQKLKKQNTCEKDNSDKKHIK